MAAGQNGFAANSDGDVDVTFSPAAFPLEVHLLDGNDYFNGRGQGGAGLHFLGPIVVTGGDGNESLLRGSSEIDSIDGGPGNDVLQGQESADTLTGGDGNDTISGGRRKRPSSTGGAGPDVFTGSGGDDTIAAEDSEADTSINGGPGFDTAFLDVIDPATLAVEAIIRPAESCTYDGVSHALSLVMTPASTATLVVVGQEIWWGQVPAPCGAATVTNTDSISIVGAPVTSETLILDQRGGCFGPGFTPETNTPEIEITTELGTATDRDHRLRDGRQRLHGGGPERLRHEQRRRRRRHVLAERLQSRGAPSRRRRSLRRPRYRRSRPALHRPRRDHRRGGPRRPPARRIGGGLDRGRPGERPSRRAAGRRRPRRRSRRRLHDRAAARTTR